MALLVKSSGEGDAKLKLTEAALTEDSGKEVVRGGSTQAAITAACSCLFLA